MRILLLRRSFRGGVAALVDDLAVRLPHHGYSAIVEDATWIPRETGPLVDREVRRQLKDLADAFDLIHVFGYRAAWACEDTFGDSIVWMYTAYEPPPDSGRLADKLNRAAHGFCSSTVTQSALAQLGVQSLELSYPGVGDAVGVQLGREETREILSVAPDTFLIGAMADDGLVEATRGMGGVYVALADSSSHGETDEAHVKRLGWYPRPRDLMHACDLWVAPDRRRGYSRNVAEAMWEGRPVLVREGMREMIEEDVSGFIFHDDSVLQERIEEIRNLELMRQTVGAAARIRAHQLFDVDERVADIAQRYRDIVDQEL